MVDVPATQWRTTNRGGPATILPDGCMDVIWTGESVLIAGPDSVAAHVDAVGSADLIGIRFDPGVAPSLLRERADALRDRRLTLDALWGDRVARDWADLLDAADDPAALLVELCAARLGEVPDWVTPTVTLLRDGADVGAVARAAGMSARTLQRQVNQRIGYGPKVFARISRFTDALTDVRARVPLADVAHRNGYADYSHMHREFVALAGSSPTMWVAQPDWPDSAAYNSTALPSGSSTLA